MQITIQISNLDQIKSLFKKAPELMTKSIHTAIQKSILVIESNAKKEAPVNKKQGGGNLRQSIRSSMSGTAKGIVEVGASYGVFVHEGTRPHDIRPVKKKALADKRNNLIFGQLVHHPGTKPNPFMERAIEKSQRQIDQFFVDAIDSVLKSL